VVIDKLWDDTLLATEGKPLLASMLNRGTAAIR
jgi:hypothetical protein